MAADVADRVAAVLPLDPAVIGAAAFLPLAATLRSPLALLKAVLCFDLSTLATFGAVVAVFQRGWLADLVGLQATGPVVAFAPVFLVGILFELGNDYEVFLTARIHEERLSGCAATEAIVRGFRHGVRVVLAAVGIVASVFASFVLQNDPIVKTVGFAFAFGVLADALLVRTVFGPAFLSFLGDRAWWLPHWLERILTHLGAYRHPVN